jgi:hypothetical protein
MFIAIENLCGVQFEEHPWMAYPLKFFKQELFGHFIRRQVSMTSAAPTEHGRVGATC